MSDITPILIFMTAPLWMPIVAIIGVLIAMAAARPICYLQLVFPQVMRLILLYPWMRLKGSKYILLTHKEYIEIAEFDGFWFRHRSIMGKDGRWKSNEGKVNLDYGTHKVISKNEATMILFESGGDMTHLLTLPA